MNSVLQASLRTASGTNLLWFRRWFFKMFLCNGSFDYKHISNIKILISGRSKWWLTLFFISSTRIQMITRFWDTRYYNRRKRSQISINKLQYRGSISLGASLAG
jgi:hypothetical protein